MWQSERSDHEETLADRTPDGGGCLDTAEAAHRLRQQEPEYSRRSVLGAIAGLGATAALPNTANATTPDGIDPDQIELVPTSGRLRTIWLETAIEHNTVQLLGRALNDDGYTFYPDDAEVLYTRGPAIDDPYYTVYLRGENDADPENTTGLIIWSQSDTLDTVGIGIAHIDQSRDGHGDHYQISQYNLMGEHLAIRSQVVENFGGCDNVHWPCVAEIGATYAAMYGSCALCASSLTPPTCAVCLSAVGWHLSAQHCPLCND